MNFYERHRSAIIIIILLVVFAVVIIYLGNKSIQNREAMVNLAVRNSSISYSGAAIVTNFGTIEIFFLQNKAPNTVNNFIKLAGSKFYDGTKFHRVIKDFMIQGGDPNSKGDDLSTYGKGGPGYQFKDEINDTPMVQGVVAMANAGPNTNGSQFFIITAPSTPWLQGGYTAFAKVTSGMDVALKISKVPTDKNDVPIDPVVVEKVMLQ